MFYRCMCGLLWYICFVTSPPAIALDSEAGESRASPLVIFGTLLYGAVILSLSMLPFPI